MKINSRTIVISSKAESPKTIGPGTRLTQLIDAADETAWYFGLSLKTKTSCSSCKALAKKMDAWGLSKCRAKRDFIIDTILENAAHVPLLNSVKKIGAAWLVEQALQG